MKIRRPNRRSGFTLIEMVTSLVILSILLVACGSAVMMAGRATGDSSVRNSAQLQAADAASQITDDLNVATNFTQRSSHAATFTVPDRLGTGSPQVVSYTWSGTTGDPLLRQFNGGVTTTLLPNVQNLNFAFTSRLMGPIPGPIEQMLFSHDAATGTLKDNALDNKNWASQYFVPNLPPGTASYTLTRVRLMLKAGPQSAVMNVSLVLPNLLFQPTGSVLAQTTVYESALSSQYEWIDVPIAGLSNQNPLQGICIKMSNASGSNGIGAVQVDQSQLGILTGANWSTTTNSGTSWSVGLGTTTARCYVFGTIP